jgi:hypothetical protein
MNELHAPKVLINETTTAEMSSSQASPRSPTRDSQNTQLTPTITDTPFKQGSSTKLPWTTNARCRNLTINAMGAEMKGHCIGPMPIEEFLDNFLPTSEIPNLPTLTFRRGIFDEVIHAERELKAYEPFVSLRDYHTGIAESLTLMFQIGTMQSFGPALSFVNTSGSSSLRYF